MIEQYFKFKIGQTVYSPFGVVKIVWRWHGKAETFYDVKFIRYNDKNTKPGGTLNSDAAETKTWTFVENEMIPFTAGGVAFHEDDAVEVIQVEKKENGDLIATIKVWFQVKFDGEFYSLEKKFQKKLTKNFLP